MGFHSQVPPWMVSVREHPMKWMMIGGTPILGNIHIETIGIGIALIEKNLTSPILIVSMGLAGFDFFYFL